MQLIYENETFLQWHLYVYCQNETKRHRAKGVFVAVNPVISCIGSIHDVIHQVYR